MVQVERLLSSPSEKEYKKRHTKRPAKRKPIAAHGARALKKERKDRARQQGEKTAASGRGSKPRPRTSAGQKTRHPHRNS
jgi:hypothetical protein